MDNELLGDEAHMVFCLRIEDSINEILKDFIISLLPSFWRESIFFSGVDYILNLLINSNQHNNKVVYDFITGGLLPFGIEFVLVDAIKNIITRKLNTDLLHQNQNNVQFTSNDYQLELKPVPSNSLLFKLIFNNDHPIINVLGTPNTGARELEANSGVPESPFELLVFKNGTTESKVLRVSLSGSVNYKSIEPIIVYNQTIISPATNPIGVKIGVIDTGSFSERSNVISSWNSQATEANPFNEMPSAAYDTFGHGTLVEDLLVYEMRNDNYQLVRVRVTNDSGITDVLNIAAGILYVEYAKCEFVNISLGFAYEIGFLKSLIETMGNINFICSAGNENKKLTDSNSAIPSPHSPSMFARSPLGNVYECYGFDADVLSNYVPSPLPYLLHAQSNYYQPDSHTNRNLIGGPGVLSIARPADSNEGDTFEIIDAAAPEVIFGTSLVAPIITAKLAKGENPSGPINWQKNGHPSIHGSVYKL